MRKVIVVVDREEGAEQRIRDEGIEYFSIFKVSELL